MSLVVEALRAPAFLPGWPLDRWELLVRQARRANLLGRLACELQAAALLDKVPGQARAHLEAALVVARAQVEAVRREVEQIRAALSQAGVDAILLKGAAYVYADLPPARGRLFSDIDLLVPHAALGEVEAALMLRGWSTTHHHPYDQRYYRRWMHELPPLQHVARQTVIDVHHALVPVVGRLRSDPEPLWAASRPIVGARPLRLLDPADMILHSATHLFLNEEFTNGLRDLVDLDSLLGHFGQTPGFWRLLQERAKALGLERPLYYGLRYVRQILETAVPIDSKAGAPARALRRLMDALFQRALQPHHSAVMDRFTPLALNALYVRAHWLKMPTGLLAYHLAAKALRGEEPSRAGAR